MTINQIAFLGVDPGGQTTKLGVRLGGQKANLDPKWSTSIPTYHDPKQFLFEAVRASVKLTNSVGVPLPNVVAAALTPPGPLNVEKGMILDSANLTWAGWQNFTIRDQFAEEYERQTGLKLKTAFDNDANAAGLGAVAEAGFGMDVKTVMGVTLGTGIGGFIIRRDEQGLWRVHRGRNGAGGELGHVKIAFPFDPSAKLCGCGQRGCVEAYNGATAFAARAHEMKLAYTGTTSLTQDWDTPNVDRIKLAFTAAELGDPLGKAIVDEYGTNLSVALSSVYHVEDPDRVLLAGGLTRSGPYLLSKVRSMLPGLVLRDLKDKVVVDYAPAGTASGWVGATYLAEEFHATCA